MVYYKGCASCYDGRLSTDEACFELLTIFPANSVLLNVEKICFLLIKARSYKLHLLVMNLEEYYKRFKWWFSTVLFDALNPSTTDHVSFTDNLVL